MNPVAVIIPTFRRPESLERAVRSVLAQDALGHLVQEIAVVDNDPAGSARATVEALRRESPLVRYVSAPQPGVATARNMGLAATTAPLIAFLDDDESAPAYWLAALHAAHVALQADVTFGPVEGRADAAPDWKRAYLEAFFSRTGPDSTGLTETVHGCGNSMMTRATALAGPAPFDTVANETGGEDDRLFQRLLAEGRRFAWAADAWVWEHAPERRQTVRYALARALGYGQTPAQIAARARRPLEVGKWMLIGAGQAAMFGALAALTAVFSLERALPLADRAARGLGKVLWFRTLRFYGQPGVRRAMARSTAPAPDAPAPPVLTKTA